LDYLTPAQARQQILALGAIQCPKIPAQNIVNFQDLPTT
jgi:hypothetical protein